MLRVGCYRSYFRVTRRPICIHRRPSGRHFVRPDPWSRGGRWLGAAVWRIPVRATRPTVKSSAKQVDNGKHRKGRGSAGGRTRGRWLLAGGYDEISARQGRKVCNERVRVHDLIQIDVCGQWKRRGASRHIQHLPSSNILRLAGMLDQRSTCAPFQDDQFALTCASGFENYRRASDRNRHCACPDGTTARILWHAEKNRAAVELDVAPGSIETENSVRAEASNGQIGESKFRARIPSGAHACVFAHFVVQGCGSRRCVRREKLHVPNNLGNACFLFRIGGKGVAGDEQNRKRAGQRFKSHGMSWSGSPSMTKSPGDVETETRGLSGWGESLCQPSRAASVVYKDDRRTCRIAIDRQTSPNVSANFS